MAEVVIFGGTTEGRQLAEFCSQVKIPALVCVATDVGQEISPVLPQVVYHIGRLDKGSMSDLLQEVKPSIVIDATHPYATVVTKNLAAVCVELGLPHLRVLRPHREAPLTGSDVRMFTDIDAAVTWLSSTPGTIFATTGAKEAVALTEVTGFAKRVVLRILPLAANIQECLDLGYPSRQIVAMHGPFRHDLNVAMFRHFGATILLTKDSGVAGGFDDKVTAARQCDMNIAVIARPADIGGVSVTAAKQLIQKAIPAA